MPAFPCRGLTLPGCAVALSVMLSAACVASALAQSQTQGGTVSTDPAQAGQQFAAKPKQGPSAEGNAAAADAAHHPAAPPAPGPTPALTPPPNAPAAPRPASTPRTTAADTPDPALIARGQYIALASDCAPCHMSVGGTPYAGGLILNTPFGQMATPNITPDKATGIGNWTPDQFYRVIHDGIGPGHQYIYPTMVFTSYTKMPRPDVDALHAYLMSLPPIHAPRLPISLGFPFNIRLSLLGWRLLFFRADSYKNDPSKSAEWNRGAYLVEGPGHCGECHSPRNPLGGVIDSRSLAGGVVDSFLAPNISSDPRWGIGAWHEQEIVDFLRKGFNDKGVVFGPMIEVVHESMAKISDADVHAIAVYLKSTPARVNVPGKTPSSRLAQRSIRSGSALYAANCAQCHQANGMGAAGAIPNLAGNDAIRAADPTDAITPMLAGLEGQGNYGAMPRFGGALSDTDIADIANYIRTAWNNDTSPNTTQAMVRGLRATAPVGIGGSIAARDFGCPKIGDSTVPGTLASEQDTAVLASADRGNLQNGIAGVIAMVRKDNPDAASGDVVTALNAAYCPVVAARLDLTDAQKRATLIAFSNMAGQQFARTQPEGVSKVLVSAQLSPDAVAKISQAAAAAGMSPGAYIERQLSAGGKAAAN